jgi:hypothetical protein
MTVPRSFGGPLARPLPHDARRGFVRGRCQEIGESLERLDRIRTAGRERFLTSPDARGSKVTVPSLIL